MKTNHMCLQTITAAMLICGCMSAAQPKASASSSTVTVKEKRREARQWTERQINLLRTFALQESPRLWQTVQVLRAERETRNAALVKLRKELIDFGRDPDSDADYVALKAANDGLLDSLHAVYEKIEDAYIAYKKFQATPGNKEFGEMMRRVLDDGMNEAAAAESRYLQMSREK